MTALQTALVALGAYVMCMTVVVAYLGTRRRESHRIVSDPADCGCVLCRQLVEDRELREALDERTQVVPATPVSSAERTN